MEIPKISEDDFLELIRTRSAGKNSSHSVPITLKKSETNSKHELEVQKKVERGLAKESSSTSPSVQKSKIVNIQDQIDSDSKLKEVPKNHSVLEVSRNFTISTILTNYPFEQKNTFLRTFLLNLLNVT